MGDMEAMEVEDMVVTEEEVKEVEEEAMEVEDMEEEAMVVTEEEAMVVEDMEEEAMEVEDMEEEAMVVMEEEEEAILEPILLTPDTMLVEDTIPREAKEADIIPPMMVFLTPAPMLLFK